MDLKELILSIQLQRQADSTPALKGIAQAEMYLQQAYEGRYIFELIQNVRDANRENQSDGAVYIELTDNILVISNTGAPFSERGINSITTIGDSPKDSQEFIGFKGIGFKSVNEITETPYVVTEWGTIEFNRSKTHLLINREEIRQEEAPLFFIPHYLPERLSNEELKVGIVTKIMLPLKPGLDLDNIESTFKNIHIHQLLLLGNLSEIVLNGPNVQRRFSITKGANGKVEISHDGQVSTFKHFKPSAAIAIPPDILVTLENKERDIYEKSPFVDISVLIELEGNSRLVRREGCKLYLFYPMDIGSGFSFIIHSYFQVSPDRKTLRNSPLNRFILEQVAKFISGEWLATIKQNHKATFLDVLAFTTQKEPAILSHLYSPLIEQLKKQKLIFDRDGKKMLRPSDIIISEGFDKGLFPSNKLNGKKIVYLDKPTTLRWLRDTLDVDYLYTTDIQNNIEKECIVQAKHKNIAFFQHLYNYFVKNDDFNLIGKKALITSNYQLLSSDDYVFYRTKEQITFPPVVAARVHFIHPKISVVDQKPVRDRIGFSEFRTELVAEKLIQLYKDIGIDKLDVLHSLLLLNMTDHLANDVKKNVYLPLNNGTWVRPLETVVHIPSEQISEVYPEGPFLDLERIESLGIEKTTLLRKLRQLGAWNVPGVYHSSNRQKITTSDERFMYFKRHIYDYNTDYYELLGDWCINVPTKVTKWFTESILANWSMYEHIIGSDQMPTLRYKSRSSDSHPVPLGQRFRVSGFLHYLKQKSWIMVHGQEKIFRPAEVVAIDPMDNIQPNLSSLKKYLNLLVIKHATDYKLLNLLNICHLDGTSVANFKQLFQLVHKQHMNRQGADKEFVNFYNKLIQKLYDFYSLQKPGDEIKNLATCTWLGINTLTEEIQWMPANQIFYLEDRPSYEILPEELKQEVQPHFTTRDKNRFLQISRRIGRNIKKTIDQKLVNVRETSTVPIWKFFPSFAQALALVEVIQVTNLDDYFGQIKQTSVMLCEDFGVELYKDGELKKTLNDIRYKVDLSEGLRLYVRYRLDSSTTLPFALILHDLLVEVLNRDLNTSRLILNSFFGRSDKKSFLEEYEVSPERVEQISSKFDEQALSHAQSFWLSVLQLKSIDGDQGFFVDGTVRYGPLCATLGIDESMINGIDYEKINNRNNLVSLQRLFSELGIEVKEFNDKSSFSIDFRPYFNSQLEGLVYGFKDCFEMALHRFLCGRPMEEQQTFQDKADDYLSSLVRAPVDALLYFDKEDHFGKVMKQHYPHLQFEPGKAAEQKEMLVREFTRNENAFKTAAANISNDSYLTSIFLARNTCRSLLYFPGTLDMLLERFRSKVSAQPPQLPNGPSPNDTQGGLSQYRNKPGTQVQKTKTTAVSGHASNSSPGSGGLGSGSRWSGAQPEPAKQAIGLVGEMMVYQWLLENNYRDVEWVSANAKEARVNPEGHDSHAYDIRYIDDNGELNCIEVKSCAGDDKHFYISLPELIKAKEKKDKYQLFLVLNTYDNDRREIHDLGNIFLLEEDQDIFQNNVFTATFTNLEIVFAT